MKKILWLLVLLCQKGFAAEPIQLPFSEGETQALVLSQTNINHLTVQSDWISHVECPQGACVAQQHPDDQTGSVYLTISGEKPFTLYVTTQNSRHFALQITPKNLPGQTVLLMPKQRGLKAPVWEKSSPYVKTLVDLMRAMMRDEAPEGYGRDNLSTQSQTMDGKLSVTLVTEYTGNDLKGVHYHLQNTSGQSLTLSPSHFYRPGVRAVALTEQTIPQAGTAELYLIQDSGLPT